MSKESDSYEVFVKEVHEALLKSDGVESIKVLHNVKIIGKSGASHQIDVYWEFKLAGVTYKTCIECKNYKRAVEKSHIAAFSAILEDIGNATGIFATCSNYQSGAKLFAKDKGIRLILINHLIKEICIKGKYIIPSLAITGLEFDREHVREILKDMGVSNYEYSMNVGGENYLLNSNGEKKIQIKDILSPKMNEPGVNSIDVEESYLKTEIGNVRLLSIGYSVTHSEINNEMLIPVNEISNAILEDVLENSFCYINDDGSVTEIES